MIIRHWRGLAKKKKEAVYVGHFREEVLPQLRQFAGFHGAAVLRRETGDGVEVTVLTRWESMETIRMFAGVDADMAVVADAAQSCFHSFDKTVTHHEVVFEEGPNHAMRRTAGRSDA
jgi:heme-degrading monooxygenase HmoA